MCILTSRFAPSCGQSVPGVRKFWIGRKANAQLFRYTDDDFSIVTWILNSAGSPTTFFEFDCDVDFVTSEEQLDQSVNGKVFPQSFVFRIAKMAKEKRSVFEAMIYDQVVVVYEDRNGRYWLLGQEFGLKLAEYLATPDVAGGGNRYVVKFVGREKVLQREVDRDNFIYVNPNAGDSEGIPITPIKVGKLGGLGPNGGITEVLNTWQNADSIAMPLSQLGVQPIIAFL